MRAISEELGEGEDSLSEIEKYRKRVRELDCSDEIKKMVERQKNKYGWEFIFLAANIDAVETARGFGISEDRAVNYHPDSVGTACLYDTVSDAVCNVRQGKKMADNWSEKLNRDYENRKK